MNNQNINAEGISVKQLKLLKGEKYISNLGVEVGILLHEGKADVNLNGKTNEVKRKNVFEDTPSFVHISPGDNCEFSALENSEIVVIEIENENKFISKLYQFNQNAIKKLGQEKLKEKDARSIIDIVNYNVEPKANIVIGEVIADQGSWSSYPPHIHPQPEVYLYKFERSEGFGVSIVGEEATIVKDGHITIIPGDLPHPQVTAPGYKMYYTWIIRNLPNNPWNSRNYVEQHKHLLEE